MATSPHSQLDVEVDGHEREQQIRRQLLIPSLLQTNDTEPCADKGLYPECEQELRKSVCTMFLNMYKKSLSELAGGVITTGPQFQLDVEVEPCSKRA